MLNIFKRKIKPIKSGYLTEKDGHRVYYEQYGNPKGQTVLSFHGGPGSSSSSSHASCMDLKKYNVFVFDQRGCGKSVPFMGLDNNTAQKAIEDAKRILDLHNITGKIIVKGSSWGSNLTLLFAEKYPKLVDKILVFNVFLGRKDDTDWLFNQTKMMYPDLYDNMVKNKPKNKSIAEHYYKLFTSTKKRDIHKAMKGFSNYEKSIGKLKVSPNDAVDEDSLGYCRVFSHYLANDFFLKDNQILKNIKHIQNKPCLIVQNRLDLLCPLIGAYELNKIMKKSKLIINPALGHGCYLMKNLDKDIADFLL